MPAIERYPAPVQCIACVCVLAGDDAVNIILVCTQCTVQYLLVTSSLDH